MIDLHNHTAYCHHAEGRPEEFVERARELGITEYGFAEHSPWMFQYKGEGPIAPSWEEFRAYEQDMQELQEEFAGTGIHLRIGIELDFIPAQLETARRFTVNYPFDFHIGSVHNLGNWIFDHPDHLEEWEGRDVEAVYREYFRAVREMLRWGFIDILGHLDLPKKFGHQPATGYGEMIEKLIPNILESGVVVEVNTAGMDKPVGEFYPSPTVVERLARAGVPFTLGSDAHRLSEVGRYQTEALDLLRSCGVTELITFEKRRRISVPI